MISSDIIICFLVGYIKPVNYLYVNIYISKINIEFAKVSRK